MSNINQEHVHLYTAETQLEQRAAYAKRLKKIHKVLEYWCQTLNNAQPVLFEYAESFILSRGRFGASFTQL